MLIVEFTTGGGTGGTGGDPDLIYSACSSAEHTRLVDSADECRDDEGFIQWNAQGPVGPGGINCWDLNQNHINDPEEDVNSDGVVNVLDCRVIVVATPTTVLPTATPPVDDRFGGTLKIASIGSIQSFDPLWTSASSTANVSNTILEPLMAQKTDFTHGKALTDSWSISSDGLTWTWKIRSDVKFHDGTPLTTKEVAGTLRRQHERADNWKVLVTKFGFDDFDQMVTVVDDLTFEIHLREPTGLVIDALSTQGFQQMIVTEDWYSVPASDSASGEPNGTGPYKFGSWTPGDRWIAVRNDDYTPSPEPADNMTGEKVAYFDTVEWIEIADMETRIAALETGEVDWVQEFAQYQLDQVTSNSDLKPVPQAPFRLLGHFNHIKPPWNDPVWGVKLRQAVVMAYDNMAALQLATDDPDRWRLCPSLLQCGSVWESDRGADGLYAANDVAAAREIVMNSPYAGMTLRVLDPQDRQPAHGAAQVTRDVLVICPPDMYHPLC